MDTTMKILQVSPFDFVHPGGVTDHILHLDRQLRAQGHETRIIRPRSRNEDEGDDGHVYRLGLATPVPANGSTARVTLSPLIHGKVRDFLRSESFDIVHIHEPLSPAMPLFALLNSQSVNVGTFHASRSSHTGYNMLYILARPILQRMFDRLDASVAVSPVVASFMGQYYPGDYRVIPNGIDTSRFGPDVPPVSEYTGGGPTILFVGRYNESRKGLKHLLQAMPEVVTAFPSCRLLVVGPGNPERFEQHLTDSCRENIVFVGEVDDEQLASYYSTCDVFCAPSTGSESFGIVLLEAMASGRPIVASNINGYSEVARDRIEGLLVEPEHPEALANALVEVLSDDALQAQLAQAGLRRAAEHDWPAVARRLTTLYETCLSTSSGGRVQRARRLAGRDVQPVRVTAGQD
jgi:phosphatidyl-myo-inositol alpha-mannosyltransferase